MVNKWTVYAATYSSYTIIHSIRTCWASLKTQLNQQPFEFSQKYLGVLDMFVLFTIAILLNIFGGEVEKHSQRKLIFIMMSALIVNLLILFGLLLRPVTSQVIYFVFYGSVGVLSCLAWPVCLYTTSQYFTSRDATALAMWSSVSQCGDFVAFIITLLVISDQGVNSAYSMLGMAILMVGVLIYNFVFFRERPKQQIQRQRERERQQNEGNANQNGNNLNNQLNEQIQTHTQANTNPTQSNHYPQLSNGSKQQMPVSRLNFNQPASSQLQNQQQQSQQLPPVTFINVWTLPGVALPVLAFSTVKSINAIIVSWLVLYFNKIQMVSESRIIAIAWTCSIVGGGFISAQIYIIVLFTAGFVFYLLEDLHVHPNQFYVIFLISICAILVGGPYNQLGTAVPLKLSENPQIKNRPKARATIISLMQGFATFMCGISVLIVPSIGIIRLHEMAGALCFISVGLLLGEQVRIFVKSKYMPLQIPNAVKDTLSGNGQNQNAAPPIQLKQQI